jgi:hypothetical protein
MRPTENTMRRTSVWLQIEQIDELAITARRVGSNSAQLIRDYVAVGLNRQKRSAKLKAQK